MRALGIVIAFAGVLLLAINLPTVLNAIQDFRTDLQSQSYQVSTGVGVTSANVVLSSQLWDDNVAHVTSVSSNISEPATASSYDSSTKTLTITGLTANTTRTLTVQYKTAALDDYTAAEDFIKHVPTVYVFGLIGLAMAIMVGAFLRG